MRAPEPEPTESVWLRLRRRWWRMMGVSALIQLILITIAWYAIHTRQQSMQASSSNAEINATVVTSNAPSDTAAHPSESISPHNTTPVAPATPLPEVNSAPTHSDTHSPASKPSQQRRAEVQDAGAQPLPTPRSSAPSATPPTPSQPAEHHRSPSPQMPNTAQNPAASATAASTNTPSSAPAQPSQDLLTDVPVAVQNITYQAQLSYGQNTITLPNAHLRSQSLGNQRYQISLSDGTATAGEGHFGWYAAFTRTDSGWQPIEVSGGVTIRDAAHPLRAALGLGLLPDGQNWYWGKKANQSARTHVQFLERVSLIAYVQGILRRNGAPKNTQWQLPLAGGHAVRMLPVQTRLTDAPAHTSCQPCAYAHVSGPLGEINDWAVWYDGARDWRPVRMQMRLAAGGASSPWLLTLSEP